MFDSWPRKGPLSDGALEQAVFSSRANLSACNTDSKWHCQHASEEGGDLLLVKRHFFFPAKQQEADTTNRQTVRSNNRIEKKTFHEADKRGA